MSDTSGLGEYQNPVRFDFAVATEFAAKLREAAGKVTTFEGERGRAESMAAAEFRGFFSQVFRQNMRVCSTDATEFSAAFTQTAAEIEYLTGEARKENERRQQVRDYLASHADENWLQSFWDWCTGSDDAPIPKAPPPASRWVKPPRDEATASEPGVTGAFWGYLECGSSKSDRWGPSDQRSKPGGLTPASALEGLYEQFRARCQYGSLIVDGLFGQYRRWMGLNDADVTWLEAVGRAFAAAGGTGSVKLADVALEAGLRAAGLSVTREDIQVSSPTLSEIDPATGYIEDPVNSATGNFVLPETDLAFGGPSQELVISRMYNSTLAAAHDEPEACGVLGPGWSTILDQRLIVTDEQARWVRDDGREIVFPLTGRNGASGSPLLRAAILSKDHGGPPRAMCGFHAAMLLI